MTGMVIITADSIYCIISMCRKILFGQGKKLTGQGKVREFSVAWSVATLLGVPKAFVYKHNISRLIDNYTRLGITFYNLTIPEEPY